MEKFTVSFNDRKNSRTVEAVCASSAVEIVAGASCRNAHTVAEYGGGASKGGHDIYQVLMDDGTNRRCQVSRTQHGGPGRGQGLKAADGASGLERKSISIDPTSAGILRAFGDGDLSLGIRRAAVLVKSHA